MNCGRAIAMSRMRFTSKIRRCSNRVRVATPIFQAVIVKDMTIHSSKSFGGSMLQSATVTRRSTRSSSTACGR